MPGATRVLLLVGTVATAVACSGSAPPPAAADQGVHRSAVEWTDSVVTRALIWSPIGRSETAIPALIFSPGFGVAPSQYSTLLARWARGGYVVVAIAHPEFTQPDEVELYDASNVIADSWCG